MGRLGSIARVVLPSAVAGALAAIAAGLIEAGPDTGSVGEAIAATGFVALFGFPLGLALGLLGRALWWAWRPASACIRCPHPVGWRRSPTWSCSVR